VKTARRSFLAGWETQPACSEHFEDLPPLREFVTPCAFSAPRHTAFFCLCAHCPHPPCLRLCQTSSRAPPCTKFLHPSGPRLHTPLPVAPASLADAATLPRFSAVSAFFLLVAVSPPHSLFNAVILPVRVSTSQEDTVRSARGLVANCTRLTTLGPPHFNGVMCSFWCSMCSNKYRSIHLTLCM